MLVSPEFLFRIEQAARGSDGPMGELDSFSKASRLSFFLTDSTPDAELLRAATEKREQKQMDEMAMQVLRRHSEN